MLARICIKGNLYKLMNANKNINILLGIKNSLKVKHSVYLSIFNGSKKSTSLS